MTAIVSGKGELLMLIESADADAIAMNTPHGARAVSDPPHRNMYYLGGWLDIPPSPADGFIFDYDTHSWTDTRSIQSIREVQWFAIKSQRDQLEFGGFKYAGNVYDSDQVSQGRIMGAAIAGIDQVWTLANNTTVNLNGDELKELYIALQAHVAAAHERGRIAREKIENAQTIAEIESVSL